VPRRNESGFATDVKLIVVSNKQFLFVLFYFVGVHGSEVVKALCYKSEGRGFDTR
jgi:hypothetical protein